MDQPPYKPPLSEAATVPGVAPADGPTMDRLPAAATDGPKSDAAASAVHVPLELVDHPRYRVLALLGQGGMGAVYKAEHRRMERLVALKVVNPGLVHDSSSLQRFHQEVRAAAKLQHPHIVTAFDADQAGDLHFLVMEFVEGQSLADYLERHGPLPVPEACEYARQAALGLQHAHEQGMVHRDVKPHNLMRTPQGQIKILDFGLARLGEARDAPDAAASPETAAEATQLTAAGMVMGTADYISPEQANDSHSADIRADIYSLGCTLYHLLTGRTPFSGGSTLEKVLRHAADQPDALAKVRRGLPAGLAAVVLRMMAKDPAQRYQTPAEVARALAPFTSRRKRRLPLIAAALAVVLVAAAAILVFIASHKKDTVRPATGPVVPAPDELARRPSAADALKGEASPGSPDLAAILGDERFRLYGQTGFPAFSPDGKVLAVPSGPDVLIFDTASGRRLRTLLGHANRVFRVVFSGDGQTLASASTPDHVVKLWDAAGGKERDWRIPADACGAYPAFDFGPGGKTFAVIDAGGVVHLFDLAARKETALLPNGPKDACSLAFRPDGLALAAAARDGALCVWDVPGRTAKRIAPLPQKAEENACVAYSPDGSLLAASNEEIVKVRDGRSLDERWSIDSAGAGLTAFSQDDSRGGATPPLLFTAARDCGADRERVVRRWQAATGAPAGAVTAAGKGGFALYALTRDGNAIAATANSQLVVRIYDAETGKPRFPEPGHVAAVHALAYSPDGATLASGGDGGVLQLWDLSTGQVRLTLTGSTGAVRALAFSPEASRGGVTPPLLASGGADGSVRIWNVADGKIIHTLSGHAGGVEDLAFSPDGRTLASCGKDHCVRLWDAASGAAKGEALTCQGSVNGVAFRPDGRSLVSVGDDRAVTFWDMTTHHKEASQAGDVHYKAAFFPDGATLATVGDDRQVRRWDAKGTPIDTLSRSAFKLTQLAIRADGRLIAATGGDTAVRLWDAADPSHDMVFFVGPLGAQAGAIAFSPEGRYLAVAGPDGTIRLFRLAAPGVVFEPPADGALAEGRRLIGHEQPLVHSVAFEKDAAHVLTCCEAPDNKVRRWDAETGTTGEPSKNVKKNAGPVAFLPDGRRLLSGGSDGNLRLWDFQDGKQIYAKEAAIQAIALSADGRFALTGEDKMARLWDVETGTVLKTFPGDDKPVRCVALAQDGEQLVILTPGPDHTLRLWDQAGESPLRVFPGCPGEAGGLCASADGRRAAWGGDDGLIHVWDLKSGEEIHRLAFRDDPVHAIAFSPDGRRLMAAGRTGLLSLWDVETGRVLDRTRTAPVSSLAFAPDGLRAVIGCDDATAVIWRLPRLP